MVLTEDTTNPPSLRKGAAALRVKWGFVVTKASADVPFYCDL